MAIVTAMISDGKSIFASDAIEYQGRLWIVGGWLEAQSEGYRIPERIILPPLTHVQDLRNQSRRIAEFSVSVPIPRAVLDGTHPDPRSIGYEVVERPDIRFPLPTGMQ